MYIFVFIFVQYTAQSFIKFIANYKKSAIPFITNYIQPNTFYFNPNNDYIINDLKRQLNEEKINNKNLLNENNNLKNTINNLNNTIYNLKINITNYINKIKSLENQLNNYIYNNNLNNNQINSNYITSLNPGEKMFSVNFVSMGFQDIINYSLPCKNTDLFVRLEEKLNKDYPKLKDQETYFLVRGNRIKRFKTLEENKIKFNDVINVFINDAGN